MEITGEAGRMALAMCTCVMQSECLNVQTMSNVIEGHEVDMDDWRSESSCRCGLLPDDIRRAEAVLGIEGKVRTALIA